MNIKTLALLGAVACIVPIAAIQNQFSVINIEAAAEDDCERYHGAYALDQVIGMDDRPIHYVICQYKGWLTW
jgi:hypothetical protein